MLGSDHHNAPSIQIAVVGDVHDQWEEADAMALKQLGVDLVLFVGDFGNESVSVVRAISGLNLPTAAIFGNHDAWYTATAWGRKKCPYNRQEEDWVQEQLDLFKNIRVGYRALDFPALGLSVVGSRPFSWGGSNWAKYGEFYRDWFGVASFEESAERIASAAAGAACETIVFLGHNGPRGLGDLPEDPCGKDWEPIGGDHGDPDFSSAIAQVRQQGKTIPLVAFGHMHHRLRHTQTQLRRTLHVSAEGTVYLNAASVPRIVKTQTRQVRNFSIVSLQGGEVRKISLVWVDRQGEIVEENALYSHAPSLAIETISSSHQGG